MDRQPDQLRALAKALQDRAEAGRLSELTPNTARTVAEALRFWAYEGFGSRVEMLIVEASDLRYGDGMVVVGEASDMDAARALFDVICRKQPGSQVTMRKRGWVIGSKRPGEKPLHSA